MDNTVQSGEWQIFRRKKNKGRKESSKSSCREEDYEGATLIHPVQRDQLCKRIMLLTDELENCVQNLFDSVRKLRSSMKFHSLVCYGLGSPVSCHESRCQVALIVGLRSKLMEAIECHSMSCHVFDPVLSKDEYNFLEECFGLHAIGVNEECTRLADEATLFFMPHLDTHFYNNLLKANWRLDRLKNVFILGNSFRYITDNTTDREAAEKFNLLRRVSSSPLWTEFSLSDYNLTTFESSFNQVTLQGFSENICDEDELSLRTMVQLAS